MLREIVAAFMIAGLAGGQTTPVIDIVDVVPRNRINEPATVSASVGKAGGDVGTSRQESSLNIEIVSATIAKDTEAPTVVFQVRLRNIGQDKLAIPIDPNLADFEPALAGAPYSYISAHIFVVLQETKGILQGVSLYGSKEITGSLRDLRAGESIEIRARTPLKPINPNVISEPRSHASVKAGLAILQGLVSLRGNILQEEIRQIAPEIVPSNVATLVLG